jgi:hypothetical protein
MVIRGPAQNRTVVLQSPTSGFVLQSTPFQALEAVPGQKGEEPGTAMPKGNKRGKTLRTLSLIDLESMST